MLVWIWSDRSLPRCQAVTPNRTLENSAMLSSPSSTSATSTSTRLKPAERIPLPPRWLGYAPISRFPSPPSRSAETGGGGVLVLSARRPNKQRNPPPPARFARHPPHRSLRSRGEGKSKPLDQRF